MSLVVRAMLFSESAHRGQFRKYTGGAYSEHPRRVASEAVRLGLNDEAVAAAFLHDVVEDCGVAFEEILEVFGPRVEFLVRGLTDDPAAEGNRAARKAAICAKLAKTPDRELHTLKLLDIEDNAKEIAGQDPNFWRSMKKEAASVLEACALAHPKAKKAVKRYMKD